MAKTWKNEPFEVNVARARTLDAGWYLDPQVYELEMERLFARTWLPAARLDELTKPGDFVTTEIAREPVVLVRDQDNQIRAYYNVCPHRAGALARGKGSRKTLQCLYHGWTFALDGSLLRVPGFEGTEDFDPACFGLKPIRCESWGPYLFVNLDENAHPLAKMWGDAFRHTSGLDFAQWKLAERSEYLIDCNWKVYLDNYAEGYHVPFAHPGLNREMDLDDYYVDTYRFYSTQRVQVKSTQRGNPHNRRYQNPQPGDQICYHIVFPNFLIDTYPDNISTNILKPISPDQSLLIFEWYFKDDHDAETMDTMIKFADEIQYQDIEICEYVQTNLRSRSYNSGRFSARHENGVHHFQGLVHEFINRPEYPPLTLEMPAEEGRVALAGD